jgi:hypothetical protein
MPLTKPINKFQFRQFCVTVFCIGYLLAIVKFPLLAFLHEVSHVVEKLIVHEIHYSESHHHSHNFSGKSNYHSAKEGSTHSHDILENLSEVLETSDTENQQPSKEIDFKIDKHFLESSGVIFKNVFEIKLKHSHISKRISNLASKVPSPPPKKFILSFY